MKELVLIKSNLTSKMNSLDLFSNELTKKISCIPDYFIDENDLFNQLTKSYFQRINYKTNVDSTSISIKTTPLPKCDFFAPLDFSMGLFEHLEAMKKRQKLKMDPELSLGSKELGIKKIVKILNPFITEILFVASIGISSANFPHILFSQLKGNPNSWKLYTLTSFYWRYKGNAKEAIGNFLKKTFLFIFKIFYFI